MSAHAAPVRFSAATIGGLLRGKRTTPFRRASSCIWNSMAARRSCNCRNSHPVVFMYAHAKRLNKGPLLDYQLDLAREHIRKKVTDPIWWKR
jgi:hypothetical protein